MFTMYDHTDVTKTHVCLHSTVGMYAHRSFLYYNGLTDIVTLFGSQDSRISLFHYSNPTTMF